MIERAGDIKQQGLPACTGGRFEKIVKSLTVPLCIIGSDEKLIFLNDQFIRVFGYSYEEIPTINAWRNLAYPDEKYREWIEQTWKTQLEKAAWAETDVIPTEVRVMCKNGICLDALVSGCVIGDNIVLTYTDITPLRRSQRLLQAAYERRRRNDLLNKLIKEDLPPAQALYEMSRMMGQRVIEPSGLYLFIIDEYKGKPREHWQSRLSEYNVLVDSIIDTLEASNRIVWESAEGIGVICFEAYQPDCMIEAQKNKAEELMGIIGHQLPPIKISAGIAEVSANLAELGERYKQADIAVKTGSKIWPANRVFHYLEMGAFQILPFFSDQIQITMFIERTLGKLLNYENNKKMEFLHTLEVILLSDNLKEAADRLEIHYQTLMFRKKRLEKILGLSFDDFSARMAILTAIYLFKLKRN
jgi:PAS domain S-box-containing protein